MRRRRAFSPALGVAAALFATAANPAAAEHRADCRSVKASALAFPWQSLTLAYVVTAECRVRIRIWDATESSRPLSPRIRSTPARDAGRASIDGADLVVRALPGRADPIMVDLWLDDSDDRTAMVLVGNNLD